MTDYQHAQIEAMCTILQGCVGIKNQFQAQDMAIILLTDLQTKPTAIAVHSTLLARFGEFREYLEEDSAGLEQALEALHSWLAVPATVAQPAALAALAPLPAPAAPAGTDPLAAPAGPDPLAQPADPDPPASLAGHDPVAPLAAAAPSGALGLPLPVNGAHDAQPRKKLIGRELYSSDSTEPEVQSAKALVSVAASSGGSPSSALPSKAGAGVATESSEDDSETERPPSRNPRSDAALPPGPWTYKIAELQGESAEMTAELQAFLEKLGTLQRKQIPAAVLKALAGGKRHIKNVVINMAYLVRIREQKQARADEARKKSDGARDGGAPGSRSHHAASGTGRKAGAGKRGRRSAAGTATPSLAASAQAQPPSGSTSSSRVAPAQARAGPTTATHVAAVVFGAGLAVAVAGTAQSLASALPSLSEADFGELMGSLMEGALSPCGPARKKACGAPGVIPDTLQDGE